MGQLPVTCGLFFSLGHSTIVIIVIVAIAVSTDVYDKIGGVGDVGGIVGAAVSGSFLFLIGLANSIILWGILKERRRRRNCERENEARVARGQSPVPDADAEDDGSRNKSLTMRILGPVTRFVDRPWKVS
ncbi:hypothetical protein FRC02_009877 [Tulasnella sp. 418]|nr:hypothetical protein FRC02_009877 [Tulasnella sp. 418]